MELVCVATEAKAEEPTRSAGGFRRQIPGLQESSEHDFFPLLPSPSLSLSLCLSLCRRRRRRRRRRLLRIVHARGAIPAEVGPRCREEEESSLINLKEEGGGGVYYSGR